jgi:tetratricopeptide (TPR) repeat protein
MTVSGGRHWLLGPEDGVQSERHGLRPGTVLAGRFELQTQLGRGATADVYRALDRRDGDQVALKLLRVAGSAELAAFEREYYALRQLAHPNIVSVRDYETLEGVPFYTMVLLEAEDLHAHRRLRPREACRVLRDVASALAVLHSRRLLHRDVSSRNVLRDASGRALLVDFGAMGTMGPARRVTGTPPFVAPEVAQLQTLDGRADLFSLGALGYWLLSDRHAYPAQCLTELPERWRVPPTSLRELASDVPEALDHLILELLHLDRSARPSCAAEVIERLEGIAGLSPIEPQKVTRAYLSQPALAGREHEVAALRAAVAGDRSGPILIDGASGMGRTRLLEEAALEGRLAGWTVLLASGDDAADDDYATLLQLADELAAACPDQQARVEEMRGLVAGAAHGSGDRARVQAGLRELWLRAAGQHRLMIGVDDVDAIDEPSRAALAALAGQEPGRPFIVLTARRETRGAPGSVLELLRERCRVLLLRPLTREQTEDVLRSVFGDVAQVDCVARSVHRLSEGSPHWTMVLAEHLVDRGKARYAAGAWSLPEALQTTELPASLAGACRERLASLGDDARELAGVLGMTRCAALAPSTFPRLVAHGNARRCHAALDELLAEGVVRPTGRGYDFCNAALAAAASEGVSDRPSVHARLAGVLEDNPDPLLWPEHLLRSGRARLAIERLLVLRGRPGALRSDRALRLLERAVEASEYAGIRPADAIELRMWLVEVASHLGRDKAFRRHARPLVELFAHDSGVAAFQRMDPALPVDERLQRALGGAQGRYDATAPAARGLPPGVALTRLSRLIGLACGMTGVTQDPALLDGLPALSPLASLSPALQVVDDLVEATRLFQQGRFDRASERYERILARIEQHDHCGLEDEAWESIRLGMLYTQGVLAAARGQVLPRERLEALEAVPGHRVNAWRVRMTADLMQGHAEMALRDRRRAELLRLQDGGELPYPGSTGRIELLAHVYCDDVLGVKQAMERIEVTAARYPRWRPTAKLARAHYLRLRGEPRDALALMEELLDELEPTGHVDWGVAAASMPLFLIEAGQVEEAVERGRSYLDIGLREHLSPTHRGMLRTLAEALVCAGRSEEAIPLVERCIEECRRVGTQGMSLGLAYETRARAALGQTDQVGFVRSATACAHEYRRGYNPHLRGRFERLLREAADAGVCVPETLGSAVVGPDPRMLAERLSSSPASSREQSDELATM